MKTIASIAGSMVSLTKNIFLTLLVMALLVGGLVGACIAVIAHN
jgi:hypothetical protein